MTASKVQNLLNERLFDLVPSSIAVIDQNYRIVVANRTFVDVFGEWEGRRCYEVYKNRSCPCVDCVANKVFSDGKIQLSDKVLMDRHGKKTDFVVHVAPVKEANGEIPYVIEMFTDVTEVKRLEQEYQTLFEGVPCYIAVLDEDLVIVRANKRFRDTFGQPSQRHCYEVYKRRPHACADCPARKTFDDGQIHSSPQEGVAKDGSRVDYVVTTSPFSQDGDSPTHVIEMALDVTELRTLERELLDAERLAAVGQTVAGIAHGVKNILMGLEGGMYVVNSGLRRGDRSVINQGWEMLERNIERISNLIRDFLAFSKGRAPEVEVADPNEIAKDVVALYQDAARGAGIELRSELSPDVRNAPLDPKGIHACLTNLVSNAMDACQMSERRRCCVTVRTLEENDALIFEVADNGCGMDYEIKQKVFTTFFTTKGTKGTGLGLLETRRIVREHGGRILVDSTPNEGSVFRLVFPRHRLPSLTK